MNNRIRLDHWHALLAAALPALVLAVMGYQRRWVSEDAFISLHVVDNILAGNGPVFNQGERVEAYTHPLWVAILSMCGLVGLPTASAAVALGIAGSTLGVFLAGLGSWRLYQARGHGDESTIAIPAPFGALVVVALPVVWDFVTSGLETGLMFGWFGLSWWLLVCRCTAPAAPNSHGMRPSLTTAAVVGLGVLIRPDLALFSASFLLVLLMSDVAGRPRAEAARRGVMLALTAVALPVVYQVFRMGYFAAIVPNTALAKEASVARWGQGWLYVRDLFDPYYLWLPVSAVVVFAVVMIARDLVEGRRVLALVTAAPVATALLHAVYVVRVGGDFMHGRFLLPTLFALILPLAVVPLPRLGARPVRTIARGVVVGGVAVWAVVTAIWLRYPYPAQIGPDGIADERSVYVDNSGHPHPISLNDYAGMRQSWVRDGRGWRAWAEEEARVLIVGEQEYPLAPGVARHAEAVALAFNIGLAGVAAGPDVHIIDRLGLADPLASRLEVNVRGRPGHEKQLPDLWAIARFADPSVASDDPSIVAARSVLACPAVEGLLSAVSGPLTPARFLANLGDAFTLHRLRVPADPHVAQERLCE